MSTTPTVDAKKPSNKTGIRRKVFQRFLPLVILPMLALSAVAFLGVNQLGDDTDAAVSQTRDDVAADVVAEALELKAEGVAGELEEFVENNIEQVRLMAQVPSVVNAARAGGVFAESFGFGDLTIDESEDAAPTEPENSLEIDPLTTEFLRTQAGEGLAFGEIFFTDVNGLNVSSTGVTSDFVQRDEDWWQQAFATGFDLGDPEFDESAGTVAFDVSVRIDDPETGAPLGVLKAVMRADIVTARAIEANGETSDVITIALADGRFVGGAAGTEALDPLLLGKIISNERLDALRADSETPESGAGFGEDVAYGFAQTSNSVTEWYVLVERPNEAAFAPLAGLDSINTAVDDSQQNLLRAIIIALIGGVLLAAFGAHLVARGVVQPIRRLVEMARTSAQDTMPAAVASISSMEDGDEFPDVPPIVMNTGDELETLASAMNSLQTTATGLAFGEAKARKARQDLFMNLGRRSQKLAVRQLDHLETLEQNETIPETLDGLLQVDHLATRMRRNAESLLILADQDSPRRYPHAVSIRDLVRAAASEIVDYQRIELADFDHATVRGEVVGDVIHLLAELVENAARFSNPSTNVEVVGRWQEQRYQIFIVDRGVGLPEERLAQLNARLADPVLASEESSSYLGIQVVSRLAERRGIEVALFDGVHQGTTVKILLPAEILSRGAGEADQVDPAASDETFDGISIEETPGSSDDAVVKPNAAERVDAPAPDELEPVAEADAVAEEVEETVEPEPEPEITKLGFARRRSKKTDRSDSDATDDDDASTPVTVDAVYPVPTAEAGGSAEPVETIDEPSTTPSGFKRRDKLKRAENLPKARVESAEATPEVPVEDVASNVRNRFAALQAGVAQGRTEIQTREPGDAEASEDQRPEPEQGSNDNE